uniref:Uncharacterized protein n=1 Tax=Coccidioides posadasii RMSCC 3488 TaxID=454284 RepID=A0A0J6FVR9_COCPO|nr:hypothetical protein CPAG_09837 [Coccidioides posadasii RMSCC 3488]
MRSGSLMCAFAAGQGGAPNGISTVADGPMGKGFEAVHDRDRLRVVSLLGRIQNSRSTPDTAGCGSCSRSFLSLNRVPASKTCSTITSNGRSAANSDLSGLEYEFLSFERA